MWSQLIRQFRHYLKLERSLSENSIEAYSLDVQKLADFAEKHRNQMNRHKLQSLLILARNYIQRDDERLSRLIEEEVGGTETLPGLAS